MTSPNSHGIRFAFGTLTVLPVRVTRWDREAARTGMLCAPLAGLVVGLAAAVPGALLLLFGSGPLLAAVASAAVPAVLTRGLHLDGLADTADGLGSGKPAQDALRIMKQSDIGPFGVITLLFVLLAQVAVLHQLYGQGWAYGAMAAVVAGVTARLALTLASRQGVPPPGRRGWVRRWRARFRCGRRQVRPQWSWPRARGRGRCSAVTRRCTRDLPWWAGWPPRRCCCGTAYEGSAGSQGMCSGPSRRWRQQGRWWG